MFELVIERAAPALEPVGDGWTVEGLAVPYGRATQVQDPGGAPYLEGFTPGAFARDCAKGGRWVNLMLGHLGDDGDRYLGRCVSIAETAEGLAAAFRIDRSHPQADAARSGELTGWSVSARVYRSRTERRATGDVTWREACGLSHVAATPTPQYAGAGVLVAREHVLVDGGSPTPLLDAIRAELAAKYPPRGTR
jgi:HK97 family phage prohead protease